MAYVSIDISKGWMPDYKPFNVPDGGLLECSGCVQEVTGGWHGLEGSTNLITTNVPTGILDAKQIISLAVPATPKIVTFYGTATGLYLTTTASTTVLNVSKNGNYSGATRWKFVQDAEWVIAFGGTAVAPQVLKSLTRIYPGTLVTLTNSTTTATLTFPAAHGYTTGDYICVAGAAKSQYNGTFQLTVIDPLTLRYTMSGNPGGDGTGANVLISPSFVDLGGSLTNATYGLIKGEQLVTGCLSGAPLSVQMSALGNVESFSGAGADTQNKPDAGLTITGMEDISNDTFALFFDTSIYTGTYVGKPWYFQFAKVIDGMGAIAYTTITVNGKAYFITNGYDIAYFDGTSITELHVPIRTQLVSQYYWTGTKRTSVVHDPIAHNIIWNLQSTSESDQPSMLLFYNYVTGSFSHFNKTDLNAIWLSTGTTTILQSQFLTYVDDTPNVCQFNDSTLANRQTVTIKTGELKFVVNDENWAWDIKTVDRVRPGCDSDTTTKTVTIGYRMNEEDTAQSSSAVNVGSNGFADMRGVPSTGRFLTVKVTSKRISALDMDVKKTGSR